MISSAVLNSSAKRSSGLQEKEGNMRMGEDYTQRVVRESRVPVPLRFSVVDRSTVSRKSFLFASER
jgi:hypothetical protein